MVGNLYFKQPTLELSIVHCISVSILRHQFDLTNWYCFDACFTSCSVQCTHWSTWMTKLSSQFKTHDYFCFRLCVAFMKCYPESDKTTVYELFYPHCLSLLRLISSRMLPPPSSLPLSPSLFSTYETMGGTFPSHRYLLRRVTSRHISIFIISYADFKVSACFSERWGSATRKPAQIAKH